MIGDVVRLHYGYNTWATERILAAAEGLSEEQFNTEGQAGNGSIRTTLVHLAETQQNWFSWFDGSLAPEEAIQRRIDSVAVADLAGLRTVWNEIAGRNMAYIAGASDEEFQRVMNLTFPNGFSKDVPLWNLLLHVANHGTQHRSEVAAMLSAYGCSPGTMDMMFYLVDPGTAGRAG